MNKLFKNFKANDYVLLFSAGASIGTLFLWGASYIFPEGEIVGEVGEYLKIFQKYFNIFSMCLVQPQFLFLVIYFP